MPFLIATASSSKVDQRNREPGMADEQFRKHLLESLGGDWPEPTTLFSTSRETVSENRF